MEDTSNSRSNGKDFYHDRYIMVKIPNAPDHESIFSQPTSRQLWVGSVLQATAGESRITTLLTEKLTPTYIEVRDISGESLFQVQVSLPIHLIESVPLT